MFASSIALTLALSAVARAQYTATYLPANAPAQSENGQTGTNQCGGGSNQTSSCQNAYINSVTDFCLWAPPNPTYEGVPSTIGETEEVEVAWCLREGYGTRLIPNGAITGAHFVQTPDYVQVTGVGNLTMLNIPNGDEGGELDPHGATGAGNPVGGLVFGDSYGVLQQYHEWTNYMGYDSFCFRACPDAPEAYLYCNHVYDVLGCDWNMPGNYTEGIFENCMGDSTEPMGIYVTDGTTSTFSQGYAVTPSAHIASPSSDCTFLNTVSTAAATLPAASLLPSSAIASLSVSSVASASSTSAHATTSMSSSSRASSMSSATATSTTAGAGRLMVGSTTALTVVLLGVVGGAALLL